MMVCRLSGLIIGLVLFVPSGGAEPITESRIVPSDSCATSGCHGGAGLNRGAYHIWRKSDPHAHAAATLTNGQSSAMAQKLGLDRADRAAACTACHAPIKQVAPALLTPAMQQTKQDQEFTCGNCHGGAEHWLLSHTRPEYPREALEKLGMRPLQSAYQRANACVACHQNLTNDLIKVNHPPLIFELDGLMVEQPKHWREGADFSHAQTWLVGQAVALREIASLNQKQPHPERNAEWEAVVALLDASGSGWHFERAADLVSVADAFAQNVSRQQWTVEQTRRSMSSLMKNRAAFGFGSFPEVPAAHRMRAVGHYAERLALALDRLNQSLIAEGEKAAFSEESLDELFRAALPPKSFDADIAENFVRKLDALAAEKK